MGRPARSWPVRLPSLGGTALALYTIVWAIALAGAVAAPLWSVPTHYRTRVNSPTRELGIDAQAASGGWRINAVWGSEALHSGLKPADTIARLDGHDMTIAQPPSIWTGPPGSTAIVQTIERGSLRSHSLTRDPRNVAVLDKSAGVPPWLKTVMGGATLLPMLSYVSAAILLFKQRRRAVAALLSLGFLFEASSNFVAGHAWIRLQALGVQAVVMEMGFTLLVIAMSAFPDGVFRPRWAAVIPFLAVATLGLVLPMPSAEIGTARFVALNGLVGIAMLARFRKEPSGEQRQQFKWLFIGFAVSGTILVIQSFLQDIAWPALVADDPRWVIWRLVALFPLTSFGAACLPLGLLVSMLGYRLYDVDQVITRSVVIGAVIAALVAIFSATEKMIELLGEDYGGEDLHLLGGGLGAALAALMIGPLHHRLSRWAEHRFRKELVKLRADLPPALLDWRETEEPETVATAALQRIRRALRSTHCGLLLPFDSFSLGLSGHELSEWAESSASGFQPGCTLDAGDKLFPLRIALFNEKTNESGWLVVGPRPDGSMPDRDERTVLSELATPLGRAMMVSHRSDERRRELEERIADLEALVSRSAATRVPRSRRTAPRAASKLI